MQNRVFVLVNLLGDQVLCHELTGRTVVFRVGSIDLRFTCVTFGRSSFRLSSVIVLVLCSYLQCSLTRRH